MCLKKLLLLLLLLAVHSYEAYGPGGTGFVIEALTDNVNRSAGEAPDNTRRASTATTSSSGSSSKPMPTAAEAVAVGRWLT